MTMSHADNTQSRYEDYITQYTNCTHVYGNLVISYLDKNNDYDMYFLRHIKEVRVVYLYQDCTIKRLELYICIGSAQ